LNRVLYVQSNWAKQTVVHPVATVGLAITR
jgi:hypothetical protein